MTAFLLQSLAWLLIAVVVGWLLGRFLKKKFCTPATKIIRPVDNAPALQAEAENLTTGGTEESTRLLNNKTLGVAATGAAAAGIASAKAKIGNLKENLPELDQNIPAAKIELPETSLRRPTASADKQVASKPEAEGQAELSESDTDTHLSDQLKGVSVPSGSTGLAANALYDSTETDNTRATQETVDTSMSAPVNTAADAQDTKIADAGMTVDEAGVDIELPEAHAEHVSLPDDDITSDMSDVSNNVQDTDDNDSFLQAEDTVIAVDESGEATVQQADVGGSDSALQSEDTVIAVSESGEAVVQQIETEDTETPDADKPSAAAANVKLPIVKTAEDQPALETTTDSDQDDLTHEAGEIHWPGSSQVKLPQVKPETPQPLATLEAAVNAETVRVTKTAHTQVKLPVIKTEAPATQVAETTTDEPEDMMTGADIGTATDVIQIEPSEAGIIIDDSEVRVELPEAHEAHVALPEAASQSSGEAAEPHDTESHVHEENNLQPTRIHLSNLTEIREALADQGTKHGIQVLWNPGETQYSSENLTGDDRITLKAGQYDKVNTIHCGVTRTGFIAVGGYVSDIDDGQALLFVNSQVVACRDGDRHIFYYFSET